MKIRKCVGDTREIFWGIKTPVRFNSENHKPSDSYSRSRKERPVDIYLKGEKKFPNRKKLYFLNLVLHLAYPSVK